MKIESPATMDRAGWAHFVRNIQLETRNLIGGRFMDARSGRKFQAINPVDNSVICEVARSEAEDVDAAVESARLAFRSGVWAQMAPRDRMDIMYRCAELIREHTAEFAALDVLNVGKPISNMLNADIPAAIRTFQFMGECVDKIAGQVATTAATELSYILREPLGVVGAIVPWNFPLMTAVWKVAPALAAGNSVVLKPAEQSPLSANLLARLFLEAGGPPGVFNVVQGYGHEAGKALALHGDVDKISFTGSTEIGKQITIYAGQSNMKRVSTECGGKSPQIIFEGADLKTAATYAVRGIFGNQGEVCSAGSRLLIHEKIHDAFLDEFIARSRSLFQPGDPFDPKTQLGPLVTKSHQKRVLDYIAVGSGEGAKLRFGGGVPEGFEKGCYVAPTLFADVRNDMRIAQDEIFGPVAAVIPFKSAEEAIAIANDSIYGLAASVWTNDLSLAHRTARSVQSGIVWINCFAHSDMTLPWGGYKQSGQGRDKCFETVLQHTQTKAVWLHLGTQV